MGIAEIRGFAESLESGDRAELFGILLDMADEADPVDSGSDSVTEAIARRSEVEAGESTMLSDDAFWGGSRRPPQMQLGEIPLSRPFDLHGSNLRIWVVRHHKRHPSFGKHRRWN